MRQLWDKFLAISARRYQAEQERRHEEAATLLGGLMAHEQEMDRTEARLAQLRHGQCDVRRGRVRSSPSARVDPGRSSTSEEKQNVVG